MNKLDRTAVVVSSCDAFADCWEPLLFSLQQCWQDCPWPIYVISNFRELESEQVDFIKVGEDKGWASNLKTAISRLDVDWIIYLQEDYWLINKVNNQALSGHIEYCAGNDIDYLRLSPPFQDESRLADSAYCEHPLTMRYRLCLQAAIWNKEALDKCLIENWSGWDFEYNLEDYLRNNNILVNSLIIHSSCMSAQGFSYIQGTAVRKGRWTIPAVEYLKEHNFTDLIPLRPVEGRILFYLMHIKNSRMKFFARVAVYLLKKLNINI